MRRSAGIAVPLGVATVALVVLLATRMLSTSRSLAIWILLLAAIALSVLVRRLRRGDGPQHARRFEAALRGRPPAAVVESPELVRTERELALGVASAAHAHRRLLPLLRAAAAARLSSRHGIELDRRPDAARALLGDDVWDLVRPDRPEPQDRHGPGVPRKRVAAAVERLESL